MKDKNEIGEITFENFIHLRDVLEEAWNRGKFEQASEDLKKETNSYLKIAKMLGVNISAKPEISDPKTFQEWFLEIVKKTKKI